MRSILQFLKEGRKLDKEEEKKVEGVSVLDKILNNEETEEEKKLFDSIIMPNGPTIYAFITDKVNDCIKVGYTDQHPLKRIEQWKKVYGEKEGEVTLLGYWSSEEFDKAGNKVFFWDHQVHKTLRSKKFIQVEKDDFYDRFVSDKGKSMGLYNIHFSREFFYKYKDVLNGETNAMERVELTTELLEDLLNEIKDGIKKGDINIKTYKFVDDRASNYEADIIWKEPENYKNTDLQEECIKNGVNAIKNNKKNILMAAVMRFGKTHAAYEIVKKAGLKRVIVTSAKADVRKSWRDDINHIDFFQDFVFIEFKDKYKYMFTHLGTDGKLVTQTLNRGSDDYNLDAYKDKTIILFATLQDLAGSIEDLKEKHQHKGLFDKKFDMMIIDETHYGSHAAKLSKVTGLGNEDIYADIEEEKKEQKANEAEVEKLMVNADIKLQVSGTPYYILASNEMIDDDAEIISKVSYTDMMAARDKWNEENQQKGKDREKPWKSPYFGMPTLHKIGLRLNKECRKIIKDSDITTSLSTLFKVQSGKFKYEAAITKLMRQLFGDDKESTFAFLKNKRVEGNKVCKHTVMVMPSIDSCHAMKKVLEDLKINRDIIVIVSKGKLKPDIDDIEQLNDRLEKNDKEGKKSIILTVNKFLTGVTIPIIDSMIYLKNASSPQEYDQNVFRLCSRYVKKVDSTDAEDESPEKVNMKDNVYLIDFNIENMFNMMANSAKMKAAAEGNPTNDRIREIMKQELGTIPIYSEDVGSDTITGKMNYVKYDDLMKYYVGYNSNKSIADIANDRIDLFKNLFSDKTFQEFMLDLKVKGDKSKNNISNPYYDIPDSATLHSMSASEIKQVLKKLEAGEDVDLTPTQREEIEQNKSKLKEYINKKDLVEKAAKEKFKGFIKSILYCNICLDEPYIDLQAIIDNYDKDETIKILLDDFNISKQNIIDFNKNLPITYKQAVNDLLWNLTELAKDKSKNDVDKFMTAIRGLGRIDKAEVVTPPQIVKKMINKLSTEDYKNAESILLVNEKQGEFFKGLYDKFGKEIADKCYIICSSEIGKQLTIKMLKVLGLNDYINKIIVDVKDTNSNGKFDINDFLEMDNNEILRENKGKKFDIILSNPPWGQNIHYEFTQKYLDIADTVISIMPNSIVKRDTKHFKKYKEAYNDYLYDVEELDSKNFEDTNMQNCCIFCFSQDKEDLHIKYIDGKEETISCILEKDYSGFTDYEKEIVKYLYNEKPNIVDGKQVVNGVSPKKNLDGYINKMLSKLPDNKAYLVCNATDGSSHGGWTHKYFSSKIGQIFDNKEDFKDFLYERGGKLTHYMWFDNKQCAENAKAAMERPLLRFPLVKIQDNQSLSVLHYRYIPNIDWEDERVKTDEGLLEVCGCPKDKCKEYADYCRKVIEEKDRK